MDSFYYSTMAIANPNYTVQRTDGLPVCTDCIAYSHYMKCSFGKIRTAMPTYCDSYVCNKAKVK